MTCALPPIADIRWLPGPEQTPEGSFKSTDIFGPRTRRYWRVNGWSFEKHPWPGNDLARRANAANEANDIARRNNIIATLALVVAVIAIAISIIGLFLKR